MRKPVAVVDPKALPQEETCMGALPYPHCCGKPLGQSRARHFDDQGRGVYWFCRSCGKVWDSFAGAGDE